MEQKTNKTGSGILMLIIRIVAAVVLLAVFAAASNFLHANSKLLQKTADTVDMNAIIAQGDPLPEGEFVSLKVYYPVASYATETSSLTIGGSSSGGFESGKDYYYLIVLENYTIMTVKVANNQDVAALDNQIDIFDRAATLDEITSYVELTGKLDKLHNSKITQYYKETVSELGIDPDLEEVTMYMLDTTAIPSKNIILLVAVIGGIILLIIIANSIKKRNAQSMGN